MKFKDWLETSTMGDNGAQDPNADRAASQAAAHIMSSPDAGQFQSDFAGLTGAPDAQRNAFFDFGTNAMQGVPKSIASQTTPNNVLFQMQNQMGIKRPFVQKPNASFMKKRMKKRMHK